MTPSSAPESGIIMIIAAYTLWGLLPVFWKTLDHIPALEILGYRIIWSFIFVSSILLIKKGRYTLFNQFLNKSIIKRYSFSALLLAVNWTAFIWAVTNGYILEVSLGYFINPLIIVLLGVIFLRENLGKGDKLAIGIAFIGVLILALQVGRFPWIALILAFSFGFYGLARKTGSLNALNGAVVEISVLFLPAVFLLYFLGIRGGAKPILPEGMTSVLIFLTGAATAVPLLLFAGGTRRIPLAHVGILQYIAPSFQFLLGVYIYKEHFPAERWIGFIVVWLALIIFTVDKWADKYSRYKKQHENPLKQI